MHLSVDYPCKVTGIPRGKRRIDHGHEWRRAEVMIADIPPSDVTVAAEITETTRSFRTAPAAPGVVNVAHDDPKIRKTTYLTTPDGGLFHPVPMAEVARLVETRTVYRQLFSLGLPTAARFRQMPDFREIREDAGPATDEMIAAQAAGMYHCDGVILKPAPEPVIAVKIDGNGRYTHMDITQVQSDRWRGGFNWFRLPQFEEAIAWAERHDAPRGSIESLRRRYRIEVPCPDRFTIDTRLARLVQASGMLKTAHAPSLALMPTDDIMAWTALRDGHQAWADRPGEPDFGELEGIVRTALEKLEKYGKIKPHEIRSIRHAIGEAAVIAEDMEVIEGFGGPGM